jgi:hypothetical protein
MIEDERAEPALIAAGATQPREEADDHHQSPPLRDGSLWCPQLIPGTLGRPHDVGGRGSDTSASHLRNPCRAQLLSEKGTGLVVRSTLRAVPATCPVPFSDRLSASWSGSSSALYHARGLCSGCCSGAAVWPPRETASVQPNPRF